MDAAVADTVPARAKAASGTMFVGPVFDYLLIGGVLSWIAGAILFFGAYNFPDNDPYLWWAILVSNWAHFAASTVRLYTRPGAVRTGHPHPSLSGGGGGGGDGRCSSSEILPAVISSPSTSCGRLITIRGRPTGSA
jgi:hypothetical protein